MKLSDRIIGMSEYCDAEAIAKAVGISVDLVEGVLSGDISEEALENYDPANPPEIRLVEQKKFIRSRVIGIMSPGGHGGSLFCSALADSLVRKNGSVMVLDYNEYPVQALYLDMNNTINILHEGELPIQKESAESEHLKGLYLFEHRNPKNAKSIITEGIKQFGTVIVDCPSSPITAKNILDELDFLLFVMKQDLIGLYALKESLAVFTDYKVTNKTAIVLSFNGWEGAISAYDCKQTIKEISNIPVIGSLPYDTGINKMLQKGRMSLKDKGKYLLAVNQITKDIIPELETTKETSWWSKRKVGKGR